MGIEDRISCTRGNQALRSDSASQSSTTLVHQCAASRAPSERYFRPVILRATMPNSHAESTRVSVQHGSGTSHNIRRPSCHMLCSPHHSRCLASESSQCHNSCPLYLVEFPQRPVLANSTILEHKYALIKCQIGSSVRCPAAHNRLAIRYWMQGRCTGTRHPHRGAKICTDTVSK
jgi:hypothetical protein